MPEAQENYDSLKSKAEAAKAKRKGKGKSTKDEGLFKQVCKALEYMRTNLKHQSLNTHPYDSIDHPWDENQKVFEAYAQNKTPGAYRIFWCYGPGKGELTLIAITPHP